MVSFIGVVAVLLSCTSIDAFTPSTFGIAQKVQVRRLSLINTVERKWFRWKENYYIPSSLYQDV